MSPTEIEFGGKMHAFSGKFLCGVFAAVGLLLAVLTVGPSELRAQQPHLTVEVGQKLYKALVEIQSGKYEQAAGRTKALIEEYEPEGFDPSYPPLSQNERQVLAASSIFYMMALHELGSFDELVEMLERRWRWWKNIESESKNQSLNWLKDFEFQISTYLIKMKQGRYVDAEKYLIESRKIYRANVEGTPDRIMQAISFFGALVHLSGSLYMQKTGEVPRGENWLGPLEREGSGPTSGALILTTDMIRSVAVARLGMINESNQLMNRSMPKIAGNHQLEAIGNFHLAALRAHTGRKTQARELVEKAQASAKQAGLLLPLDVMLRGADDGKWPSFIDPTSPDYLLKIIPALKMTGNLNFIPGGSRETPQLFKGKLHPGVFINFAQ